MYTIAKKPYGFFLTFSGVVTAEELRRFAAESAAVLAGAPKSFGVLVDMRALRPMAADAQQAMVVGQQAYRTAGMERSAVVLDSAVARMQMQRLAYESGIGTYERYLDAVTTPDWEKAGLAWIQKGVEPR